MEFWSKYKTFYSRKCIWKYRLQKRRPFCPGGDELKEPFKTVLKIETSSIFPKTMLLSFSSVENTVWSCFKGTKLIWLCTEVYQCSSTLHLQYGGYSSTNIPKLRILLRVYEIKSIRIAFQSRRTALNEVVSHACVRSYAMAMPNVARYHLIKDLIKHCGRSHETSKRLPTIWIIWLFQCKTVTIHWFRLLRQMQGKWEIVLKNTYIVYCH